MRRPALLFGVTIADVTMSETLDVIGRFVADGRRHGRTHQVATVNVDFLVNGIEHPELGDILKRAELCLADGAPIVWAARALGMPITERVAGADLVPLLVERAESAGWKVHFFGSAPQVADQARSLLTGRYPRADITFDSGPMMSDVTQVEDSVLDSIAERDPDILCVALGNPKQERFIRAHRARIGTPVMIGIGGSLDLLTGTRKRAPGWAQKVGLEWVVRAVQEPGRLGPRYAHDIKMFGPLLARELRAGRRRRADGSVAVDVTAEAVRVSVHATAGTPGSSNDGGAEWDRAFAAIESGAALVFTECETESLHDAGAATLAGLLQVARRCGTPIHIASDRDRLLAAFDQHAAMCPEPS